MLHEPAPQSEEKDLASAAKAKLGLQLFIVYCIVYAGFVLISALSGTTMEGPGLFGTNLAITYGMGLIALAIVLGLLYNWRCTYLEDTMNAAPHEETGT